MNVAAVSIPGGRPGRWRSSKPRLGRSMILAFIIVNNYGRARHLKFYTDTVRAANVLL